jgi:hypothetical protein
MRIEAGRKARVSFPGAPLGWMAGPRITEVGSGTASVVTAAKPGASKTRHRPVNPFYAEDPMKKAAWIMLLLGMVVFSNTSAAGEMTFGVNGGLASPTGDFGDLYKAGFQAGVFSDYVINEQFALGVGIDYVSMGASDDYVASAEQYAESYTRALLYYETGDYYAVDATYENKFSIIPITVHAKWMPPMQGSVAPYIQVGGGFYMMTFKEDLTIEVPALGYDESDSNSDNESKPGMFIGVGVDFKASPAVKVGVFANMHNIFTEGESLRYFNLGVGLSFGSGSAGY